MAGAVSCCDTNRGTDYMALRQIQMGTLKQTAGMEGRAVLQLMLNTLHFSSELGNRVDVKV